jgi:hypothetical protein
MPEVRISIFHLPKGGAPEAVEADCTVKRGGVIRLKILEDLNCEPGDVLVLDLRVEKK